MNFKVSFKILKEERTLFYIIASFIIFKTKCNFSDKHPQMW